MIYATLLPLTLLALPAFSLPTARAPANQQWTITSLKTHFVSANSGLPGGSWPPGTKFNSTLSFTVTLPENTTTNCATSWAQPDYPENFVSCDEATAFQLKAPEGQNFSEANFVLDVRRKIKDSSAHTITTYTSDTHITANDPSDPTSYLTCLGGAPLTGTTCQMDGQLSVKGPIVATGVAGSVESF